MRARASALLGVALLAALAVTPIASGSHGSSSQPNDPLFAAQWGVRQVRAEQAWHHGRGRGVTVAIVDSGIDLDHPDLASKAVAGRTFLTCGRRGCGSGDWRSGPAGQRRGSPHGTHVAGIAGAATGNGRGVAGVAPATKLLAVRVLGDDDSGTTGDIARGIRYSIARGVKVINLSLGSPAPGDAFRLVGSPAPMRQAVAEANRAGIVVVAAAGNSTSPVCEEPAFAPGVVCVTATDRRKNRAEYASGSIKPDMLAVAAPGGSTLSVAACHEGVVSTMPPGQGQRDCGYPASRAYGEAVGTSMSVPHVAGAAALLRARHCSRRETLALLRRTARNPLTGRRGQFSPTYGYGIVDAGLAAARAARTC